MTEWGPAGNRYSRREAATLLLIAPLARVWAGPGSKINGVMIGAQSYSFRDRSLDDTIRAMREIGLSYCELWAGHVEPRRTHNREQLRQWRESAPLEPFREARHKFDAAGITVTGYSYGLRGDFSDAETARGFEMAKALDVRTITASSNVSNCRRVDRYASQAKVHVGMHNHSRIVPDEFATPGDFEKAMQGASPYIGVNLDIGHFVAAGFDPIPFIERHHRRIVSVHLKDRKKNQGPDMPFGQGDTPIREVLLLMKKNRYPFPAMIEYEYEGKETVAAVRECFEYCRQALG